MFSEIDVLPTLSADYSPGTLTVSKSKNFAKENAALKENTKTYIWKHRNCGPNWNFKVTQKILLETLWKKKSLKSETEINTFLDRAEAWKLSDTKIELCEKKIIQSDLYSPMKGIVNNKSPSDDGLTKELYKTFWYEIINLFYKSIKKC